MFFDFGLHTYSKDMQVTKTRYEHVAHSSMCADVKVKFTTSLSWTTSLTIKRTHYTTDKNYMKVPLHCAPRVPCDILGAYEELRWMEHHTSSPPCFKHWSELTMDCVCTERGSPQFWSDMGHEWTECGTHLFCSVNTVRCEFLYLQALSLSF